MQPRFAGLGGFGLVTALATNTHVGCGAYRAYLFTSTARNTMPCKGSSFVVKLFWCE